MVRENINKYIVSVAFVFPGFLLLRPIQSIIIIKTHDSLFAMGSNLFKIVI